MLFFWSSLANHSPWVEEGEWWPGTCLLLPHQACTFSWQLLFYLKNIAKRGSIFHRFGVFAKVYSQKGSHSSILFEYSLFISVTDFQKTVIPLLSCTYLFSFCCSTQYCFFCNVTPGTFLCNIGTVKLDWIWKN